VAQVGKDWDAVAEAINTRLDELEMTQQELAASSGVSTATLRELQQNKSPRRRSPRLLAAVSTALRWPAGHLAEVAVGGAGVGESDRLAALEAEVNRLRERVQKIEEASEVG
jgi:transcriptional regulator with XRE-family HTH domain